MLERIVVYVFEMGNWWWKPSIVLFILLVCPSPTTIFFGHLILLHEDLKSEHGSLSWIIQAMGIGFMLDWKWVFPTQSNFLSTSSSSNRQHSSSCEFITWLLISFVLLVLLIWFLNYHVMLFTWICLCLKRNQNLAGGFLLVLIRNKRMWTQHLSLSP